MISDPATTNVDRDSLWLHQTDIIERLYAAMGVVYPTSPMALISTSPQAGLSAISLRISLCLNRCRCPSK